MGKRKAGGAAAPSGPSASDRRPNKHGHYKRPTHAEWQDALPNLKKVGDELNGPCPVCFGTDRFYVRADGGFFCRRCCPDGSDPQAVKNILDAAFDQTGPKARPNGQDDGADDPMTPAPEGPKPEPMSRPAKSKIEVEYDYNYAAAPQAVYKVWRLKPNAKGEKCFLQARVIDGKLFKPKSVRKAGEKTPLYPLDELLESNGGQAVLVEGEKCADRLRELGYNATCWMGGCEAVGLADFSPLKEFDEIVLWPDNDKPGRKAMDQVGRIIGGNVKKLRRVAVPEGKPRKWDAADATEREEVDALIEAATDWTPTVTAILNTDRPVFPMNADGFRMALDFLGIELRYNVRADTYEWREKGKTWQRVTDRWRQSTRAELERRVLRPYQTVDPGPFIIGEPNFIAWTLANCYDDGDVDPFVEWLESLPEWDGTERMAGALQQCLTPVEGQDPKLVEWCSTYIFAGAVNRALNPGKRQDESPVIIADGNSGKTTFVQLALPAFGRPDWYGSKLDMAASDQKKLEAILGKVIVEMAEMDGMRRADHSKLKEFLGCQVDNSVRLSYRRDPDKYPRRNIFVGTSDKLECLPNDPNLRRFGVVRMKAKGKKGPATYRRIKAYMDANREQLWAEALAWIKAGNKPNLPDSLRPAATEAAEVARSRDTHLSDLLDQHIDLMADEARENHGMTMTDIVGHLQLRDQFERAGRSLQNRLGTELKALGWGRLERCRREGKLVRLWMPDLAE